MHEVLLVVLVVLYAFVKGELVGYFYHRFLHSPKAGFLHRRHLIHHLELYPAGDLSSETYRHVPGFSTVWLFAPLFMAFGVVNYVLLPTYLFIAYFTTISLIAWANDYFHDAGHLRRHWLNRFAWFRRLRRLHYVHHAEMQTNFGVYEFVLDRLFGTFRKRAKG